MCCIFKCVNVLVNLLLMLAFGVVALMGALLKFSPDTVQSILETVLGNSENENIKNITPFFIEHAESLSTVLLAVGIVGGCFSLFGLISACCSIKILMKIHLGITGAFLVIELIATVVIFGSPTYFTDAVSVVLNETLTEYHDNGSVSKLVWDMIMTSETSCCGMNNYADFKDKDGNQLTPLSWTCCNSDPSITTNPNNDPCTATIAETTNSIGCREKINTFVEDNKNILLVVPLGLILIQVVVIIVGVIHLLEKRLCL